MPRELKHGGILVAGIALLGLVATAAPSDAGVVWIRRADVPTPRVTLATAVVDGKIYAIGGGGYVMPTVATVEMYDPATDTWTLKADMPTPRGFLTAAAVGGKIFAIGGFGPGGLNTTGTRIMEMYDPLTDAWTRRADMPIYTRVGLSASVVDGKIYAIGGAWTDWAALRVVQMYDPATDTWTRKADMAKSRFKVSTCVLNGKIYAIGGRDISVENGWVEVYDPATDTWTSRASMPTPRGALGTCVIDGKIYAIGGVLADNSPDLDGIVTPGVVEVYDPATDTWTQETSLPEPRGFFGASVVDGRVYAVGGASAYGAGPAMRLTPWVAVLFLDHAELIQRATREQTVATGREERLSLEVVLNGPSADGTYPPLQLDLSELGILGNVPFTHQGQGSYRAAPVVTLPENGQFQLPVWLDETEQAVLYSFSLTVLPGADLSVFGDGPGSGWTWRQENTAVLDTAATAVAYQGSRALAVKAGGALKVSGDAAHPVVRMGYDSLSLALYPSEGTALALEVGLNAHKRKNVLKLVNWADKRWQQVAIPLDSLGLEPGEDVASVVMFGSLKGTFYLDEVRLVAAPAPPVSEGDGTAVQEIYSAVLPARPTLDQNYPNPFNSDTVIRFALARTEKVDLALYNLAGQQVAALVLGVRPAGLYAVRWDGRDDQGQALATGVYLYRLRTGSQEQSRRLLLLR